MAFLVTTKAQLAANQNDNTPFPVILPILPQMAIHYHQSIVKDINVQ